jgi:hypothetical protein
MLTAARVILRVVCDLVAAGVGGAPLVRPGLPGVLLPCRNVKRAAQPGGFQIRNRIVQVRVEGIIVREAYCSTTVIREDRRQVDHVICRTR